MKKILSLVLVLCMVLTSTFLLSSCAKVKAGELEDDANTTLNDALLKTYTAFFGDDMGALDIIKGYSEKGSLTVAAGGELLGGGSISATIYNSKGSNDAVLDADFDVQGIEGSLRLLATKNAIGLYFPALLGSEDTVAIIYDSVINNLKNSGLVDIFGLTEEQIDEIVNIAKEAKEAMQEDKAKYEKEFNELINEVYKLFDQNVTTEKVDVNGESVKCVVFTITLNNANLKLAVNKVIEKLIAPHIDAEMKAEIEASVNDAFTELDAETDILLKQQLAINTKTDTVAKYSVNLSVTEKESNETDSLSTYIAIGENEIKGAFTASGTGIEYASGDYSLTKSTSGDEVKYSFVLNGKTESVTVKLLDLTQTYNKKSGDFAINASVFKSALSTAKLELKGNAKATKDTLTVAINSVKAEGQELPLELTFTLKSLSEIPSMPENAVDIVGLTAEELQTLISKATETELGQLIFGGNGGEAYPDYNPDEYPDDWEW